MHSLLYGPRSRLRCCGFMERPNLPSRTYRFPVGITGLSGVYGANVDYTSTEILRSLSGTLLTATESANIFRAGTRVGVEADHWSTELYGDNLFNNREAVTPPDVNVDYQSIRLRPRTIGLRANYKF